MSKKTGTKKKGNTMSDSPLTRDVVNDDNRNTINEETAAQQTYPYGEMREQPATSFDGPSTMRPHDKFDAVQSCLLMVVCAAHYPSKAARLKAASLYDRLTSWNARQAYANASFNNDDGPLTQAFQLFSWAVEGSPMPEFLKRLGDEPNELLR